MSQKNIGIPLGATPWRTTDFRQLRPRGVLPVETTVLLELTRPYAPDGPLCAELRGVIDVEILRRALQDLATRCALENDAEIILDLLDADSRCSLIDVRSLGDELTRLGFQPSWRMAIVGSPHDTSFAFFETIGRSHGMKVRLFKSRDAARFWLGAESQPGRTHDVR